jgi:hypothetical protein
MEAMLAALLERDAAPAAEVAEARIAERVRRLLQ